MRVTKHIVGFVFFCFKSSFICGQRVYDMDKLFVNVQADGIHRLIDPNSKEPITGIAEKYFDGKIVFQLTVVNGASIGPFFEYDANGKLVREGNYKENSSENGTFKEHLNENEYWEGSYIDGKKDGVWMLNRNKVVVCAGPYKNDLKDGTWHLYNDDRTKHLATEVYKEGVLIKEYKY